MKNFVVAALLMASLGCSYNSDRDNARPVAAAQASPPQAPAQPEAEPQGTAPSMARSHGPIVPVGTGELHWDTPKGWQETPPTSSMRRAQYKLPAATGDPEEGECVVFYFGAGQGGDASSNISRWISMMTDPDGSPAPAITSEMNVGGKKISRLKSAGTYTPVAMGAGGPPPAPKSNWVMLGAVVPGSDANWFFRCAGPRRTILAQEASFDALLNSIH